MFITNKQKFLKFIKNYKVKIDFKKNLIYLKNNLISFTIYISNINILQ